MLVEAIMRLFRKRDPEPPQDLCEIDAPVPREWGRGPYRETHEDHYTREAREWDIVNIHDAYLILVYAWFGCREPIDYKCDHRGEACDCDEVSIMCSSKIVNENGEDMTEEQALEAYGNASDGTIVRTYSGTVYRLCGNRGYHETWSPGSIFGKRGT